MKYVYDDAFVNFDDDDLMSVMVEFHSRFLTGNDPYRREWWMMMENPRCKDIWRQYLNNKARRLRVKKRVEYICINYPRPTFLTLTFSPESLARTNAKTRERAVKTFCDRVLRSNEGKYDENDQMRLYSDFSEYEQDKHGYKWQHGSYICNKDYGDQFGREHYHVLISCRVNDECRRLWYENYGIINFESLDGKPIRRFEGETDDDYYARVKLIKRKKITWYITKLWFHVLKIDTRPIYSRCPPKLYI